jgi:hypothetical protein
MGKNEFDKGIKFSFNDSIAYAENAVVSKQILKKETGNILRCLLLTKAKV